MNNKLKRIFNERFLVDIVNVWSIAKRYYRWNIAWGLICAVAVSWIYLTQDKVQHRERRFFPIEKSDASAQVNAPNIPFLKNNNKDEMDVREIWRITSSRSFVQNLYKNIVHDGRLETMAFYKHGKRFSYGKVAAECSLEQQCIRNKMIDIIGSMYSVRRNVDIPGFTLKTFSFDADDTAYLEGLLINGIRQTRQQHLMAEVDLKIHLAQEAYDHKKALTHFDSYEAINTRSRMLEAKIIDMDARIQAMQATRDTEQSKMLSLNLQYDEATKREAVSVNSSSRKKSERARALETEIAQLRENLEMLKLSSTNNEIIKQLERKLRQSSAQLTRIGKTAPTRNLSSLQKAKGDEIPAMATAAKVARKNVVKLDGEIHALEAERQKMTQEAGSLKREVLDLTPDIEMVMSLENRLKTLRIEKATTTADLLFDDIPQVVESLMRHSLRKVFFIFVFCTAFGCLALTLLLYLFDDRIYDADELLSIAPDLKVVGRVANLDI